MVGFSHTTPPNGTATKGGQHCRVTILGRRFPAHKKCSAPDEGAEHFCVRLSGRYNALYLAAPLGLARCAPGTPRTPKGRGEKSAAATNHCGRCRYVTNTISYRSVPMLPGWQPPFRVGIGVGGRHLTWADCSFVPPPDHIFSLLGKCIDWRPSAQTSPAHTP